MSHSTMSNAKTKRLGSSFPALPAVTENKREKKALTTPTVQLQKPSRGAPMRCSFFIRTMHDNLCLAHQLHFFGGRGSDYMTASFGPHITRYLLGGNSSFKAFVRAPQGGRRKAPSSSVQQCQQRSALVHWFFLFSELSSLFLFSLLDCDISSSSNT